MLLTIDGETIESTPAHPFYTIEGGWVAAGALQPGDRIQQANGHSYPLIIDKIQFVG